MAETTIASALTPQQWDRKFYMEYMRANRFKRYMGTTEGAPIQLKMQLTKEPGDRITFAFVDSLNGDGVTGNTDMEGNEEQQANSGHPVNVSVVRNAVKVTEWEEQKSAIDLRNAAKTGLKEWSMKKLRDSIIRSLLSPVTDGATAYASATEAQKDAWVDANIDRVLFGAAKSNVSTSAPAGGATYDHSGSLSNIDNTADKLDTGMVSLAKRMAQEADPAIRPIIVGEDEEWFVMFANSRSFRDLKADSALQQALREGWTRGKDNPLFRSGDLIWDGVIIREVPEIGVITGVGASSIDVGPNFLCGAQAVGVAWARMPKTSTQVKDYGFKYGVEIREIRGVEKLMRNSTVQNGVVTVYAAGVADS